MHSNARRLIAALLTLLCAMPVSIGIVVATAAPASATSYRYWTYWWGRPDRTAWQYAGLGPAADMPGDGWVLGWRFEITSPTGGGAQTPRTPMTYADLCSDPAPAPDQERVAVVVDYGDAAATPAGDHLPAGPRTVCVVVPVHSHGSDVMRAAGVSLRFENGFVCGIDGYPIVGCATPVASAPVPAPSSTATSTSQPSPTSRPSARPGNTSAASPLPKPDTSQSSEPHPTSSATSASAPSSSSPTSTTSNTAAIVTPTSGASITSVTESPTATASTSSAAPANSSIQPTRTQAPATSLASQEAPVTESRSALGLIMGLLGVALIGGSAWFTSRRRGDSR